MPPVEQADKLSPEAFSLFSELTRFNPPHANDYPILYRMRRIGIIEDAIYPTAMAMARHSMPGPQAG